MKTKGTIFTMIVALIEKVYSFLWGDLIHIPLPGGGSVGISLLIILLIPTGIYFTVRTRLLPIRMFPDMIKALTGKKEIRTACPRSRHSLSLRRREWAWVIWLVL